MICYKHLIIFKYKDLFFTKEVDKLETTSQRTYLTIKANNLIRSRYKLSALEQKALNFMISQIKPDDDLMSEKQFNIKDFCLVCGIDAEGGANYKYIKNMLKNIADKSVYIPTEEGETLIRWLSTVDINRNSGTVSYKFFERVIPFIHHLQEKFTQFELINTLAMKSQYSIRLYELLKSYESLSVYSVTLEEFKKILSVDKYKRYPDFRRFVLETAVREINEYTDIKVECIPIKQSRKVAILKFYITKKDIQEMTISHAKSEEIMGARDE